ncbi:MAG TPA: glutathione S-transferase family protein [Myxococcales bacterium]|nr:hypothetical protein [Deltaproteobacteria bacterium]MBU54799.1 hypothetical protein [Deltaproteobacteria bacterium]HAA55149.1 glutathione S-transferase family protein [Myxococcales bacterium]
MKLYQFAWGPYPRRIHIYMKEKDIQDIELVDIDVVRGESRTPEFLAKNPLGTVPVLETDDGQFIRQSSSILQYLEQRYPTPNMIGNTPEDVARTRDLLAVVNEAYSFAVICTFHASPLFVERRDQKADAAQAFHFEYTRTLKLLEALVGDGEYMGGSTPNIADIAFFASEQYMRSLYQLQLPTEQVKLEAIYQRFAQRPSAHPEPYPQILVEHAPLRHLA